MGIRRHTRDKTPARSNKIAPAPEPDGTKDSGHHDEEGLFHHHRPHLAEALKGEDEVPQTKKCFGAVFGLMLLSW